MTKPFALLTLAFIQFSAPVRAAIAPVDTMDLVQFRLVQDSATATTDPIRERRTGLLMHVEREPIATIRDVTRAGVSRAALNLSLSPEATRKMQKVSAENVGKRLAVLVRGELIWAPFIREREDRSMISVGALFPREIRSLAEAINLSLQKVYTE